MILLVANFEPHVGYAWNFIAQFWIALARHRKCHIAYPLPGTVPENILAAGIIPHTLNMQDRSASVSFIKQYKIDTIYLTDWPAFSPLYALWKLAGVRKIIIHDHAPGDFPKAKGLRRLAKSSLHALRLFSAHQYLGVAEHVTQRHIDTGCVPAMRCTTVTNGIVPFSVDKIHRTAVRRQLGIPESAILVLMVGRATKYKNFGFVLKMIPYLSSKFVFVHCGDGPELQSLKNATVMQGLDHRVQWLGKRTDVREIMSASDILFHPSKGEAMCLTLLEAACAGLPVVVPNTPSVSFTVDHMVDGLKYEANNVYAAVMQLRLLGDADLRERIGARAREKVLTNYTLDKTMSEFESKVALLL